MEHFRENIIYVIINQQKILYKKGLSASLLKLTFFAQKLFLGKIAKKYLLISK